MNARQRRMVQAIIAASDAWGEAMCRAGEAWLVPGRREEDLQDTYLAHPVVGSVVGPWEALSAAFSRARTAGVPGLAAGFTYMWICPSCGGTGIGCEDGIAGRHMVGLVRPRRRFLGPDGLARPCPRALSVDPDAEPMDEPQGDAEE